MKNTKTPVRHGSESWPTKYDIIQHKYMAGEDGFVEVLEIKDPPKGCGSFILHHYNRNCQSSSFSEWKSLRNVLDVFEATSGLTLSFARKHYITFAGFDCMTDCKQGEDPWFYQT